MNLLVFGASRGTGLEVTKRALAAGHWVSVVLRNPQQFTLQHPLLTVCQGDVFDTASFEKALEGKDTVISCLGTAERTPTALYSQGISHIIAAMNNYKVQRLICLSAGAVIVPPRGTAFTKFMIKYVLQRLLKNLYADMLVMESIVKRTSLSYTIIRPPWLRNSVHTGIYRYSVNEPLERPTKIARADLADFILNHLSDASTFQSTVELSY